MKVSFLNGFGCSVITNSEDDEDKLFSFFCRTVIYMDRLLVVVVGSLVFIHSDDEATI